MTHSVRVTVEDANNYSRILTILGMEEEGDPVSEVERLRADANRYSYARTEMRHNLNKDRNLSLEEVDAYVDQRIGGQHG